MSAYAKVRQDIADYLATNHRVALDSIAPDATLDDIGVDSLGVLEIATLLENKHGLSIELAQMTQVRTFSDLMEIVRAKSEALG